MLPLLVCREDDDSDDCIPDISSDEREPEPEPELDPEPERQTSEEEEEEELELTELDALIDAAEKKGYPVASYDADL